MKRAVLAFRSGDKQTARDLLTEAASHNPENELVWLWRASAARTRSEAYEAVTRVLDINPSNEKALVWIAKLRPASAPAPEPEDAPKADEDQGRSPNGSTGAAEAVEEQEAEAAEDAQTVEDEVETAAKTDEAVETEETVEAGAAAESVEEEEHHAEAAGDLAEGRLAALEADLGLDDRTRLSSENARDNRHIEGYGWGLSEESAAAARVEDEESENDVWERLTQSAEGGADSGQESEHDPLVALLDQEERAEAEPVPGKTAGAEVLEAETADERPAPVAKARPKKQDEEDVWASLGMAGMQQEPRAEAVQPPRAKAAAAASKATVDIEGTAVDSSEGAAAAPPAETADAAEDEEDVACFICEKYAKPQEGFCSACRAIVDLKLLDLAPRHEGADRAQLTAALDRLREKIADDPSTKHYVQAALTCLNLRQSQQGLAYLREACRLRPQDRELVGHYDQLAKRPLILAVDDSKTVQKMISTVLEKESYRVLQAEDGLSALAKLDEELPALILLDITMPRMDGYQVCKVITGNDATKHIPVVMLSGKDGFFDKVRGKMVGASNYITKPFDPGDLTKTIGKFLKK